MSCRLSTATAQSLTQLISLYAVMVKPLNRLPGEGCLGHEASKAGGRRKEEQIGHQPNSFYAFAEILQLSTGPEKRNS